MVSEPTVASIYRSGWLQVVERITMTEPSDHVHVDGTWTDHSCATPEDRDLMRLEPSSRGDIDENTVD
jgi:hypothetical protein